VAEPRVSSLVKQQREKEDPVKGFGVTTGCQAVHGVFRVLLWWFLFYFFHSSKCESSASCWLVWLHPYLHTKPCWVGWASVRSSLQNKRLEFLEWKFDAVSRNKYSLVSSYNHQLINELTSTVWVSENNCSDCSCCPRLWRWSSG